MFGLNPDNILLLECLSATTADCQPHFSEAAGRLQTTNENMGPAECHKELASHFMKDRISEPGNSITHCVKSLLFLVPSTITPYYHTAFISSSALTIIVLQMLPILFSVCHRLKSNLSRYTRHFFCNMHYVMLVLVFSMLCTFYIVVKECVGRFLVLSALFVIIS